MIVGDCGPMGMGRRSNNPMVVVEVRCGSWVTNLLGLRVCDRFWFTDLVLLPVGFGSPIS